MVVEKDKMFLWMIIEEELNQEDLKIGTLLIVKKDAPDFLNYFKDHVLIISSITTTFDACDGRMTFNYSLQSPTYPSLGLFSFEDITIQKYFRIQS